jgi:8-oxo-dGTP diphosphatase
VTQREFPSHPLVGVGGVVVDNLGRVLLVQRKNEPAQGHWTLPGGLLELGELLIEGVKREILEETGLFVQPEAIVEVVDRIYIESGAQEFENNTQEPRVRYHYVVVDYWCRLLGGEIMASSDASEVAWVSRTEWKDTNFYSLESVTVQVIEKGWQMAHEAGNSWLREN